VTIEIRDARPEEYAEAGRVTADAYREFVTPGRSWEEYLVRLADVADRARRTSIIVAVEDGEVLGTVTLELDGRTDTESRNNREAEPLRPGQAHVRMLGVAPQARGRGVGRMLMDACLEESRRAGKTQLTLNTTERMKAARRMYESMGFTRTEDTVFPDGFVLLGYRKELSGSIS
jgi:ribosomal protein S18 acetylase RimI-like enzyme